MTLSKTFAAALAAVVVGLTSAQTGNAATCERLSHDERAYTVCTANAGDDLRLFLSAPDGTAMGSFQRVSAVLEAEDARLVFAMNAGMYHADRRPVGLYIERGEERTPLVTAKGPGNFGMQPNGVFCISAPGFSVIETHAFASNRPDCRYATQSGPMLLVKGALHPRFIEGSNSRYVRNGVGVSLDGARAYFAISDGRVNFHDFARMFRDALGVEDALYFDGNISRLHAPELGRSDLGFPMGPIVGLVAPR